VLCIGEKLDRPGPLTSGAHCDHTLGAQGTDQALEGPGRDGADHRAPLQTKAAVCGPQDLAGHLRSHPAVAQDPRREPSAHGAARGTRQTPEGKTAQTEPDGRGVARQTPPSAASRLVCELPAERADASQEKLDERVGGAEAGNVARLLVEVDGQGAVCARRCGARSQVSSPGRWPSVQMRPRDGHTLTSHAEGEGLTILPRHPMECGNLPSRFGEIDMTSRRSSRP